MIKNKMSAAVIVTAALAFSLSMPALALEASVNAYGSGSVTVPGVAATSSVTSSVNVNNGNATSDAVRADVSNTIEVNAGNGTSTGAQTANEERSVVASFVQNLLTIANREKGIGSEVKVIAQEQEDSASTTAQAMINVENRGSFVKFLFGADYKSIGIIRSEIALVRLVCKIVLLNRLNSKKRGPSDRAFLNFNALAFMFEV